MEREKLIVHPQRQRVGEAQAPGDDRAQRQSEAVRTAAFLLGGAAKEENSPKQTSRERPCPGLCALASRGKTPSTKSREGRADTGRTTPALMRRPWDREESPHRRDDSRRGTI